MNKHMPYDLKQMQSLPLEAKIIMTQQRIRQWYEHWDGQVYVSFSGGKDSTVLKHIVDGLYSDVPSVFVNTGLEYPEIQKFVKEIKSGKYDCFNSDVEIIRPGMRFDEVIQKYGYPVVSKPVANTVRYAKKNVEKGKETLRVRQLLGVEKKQNGKPSQFNKTKWRFLLEAPFDISEQCCDVMKKYPTDKYEKETGKKPFLGLMASESERRKNAWLKTGCNAFEKKRPQSQPMAFWTEQDVLEYLFKFDVPYASIYGQIQEESELEGQMFIDGFHTRLCTSGVDRSGCIFCGFGCHLEKEPNRFQRLKETHPRQYAYCINGGEMVDGKWQPNKEGLGLGKVLDYIGVKYD